MLLIKELARLYMYMDAILFHLMQCNIPFSWRAVSLA